MPSQYVILRVAEHPDPLGNAWRALNLRQLIETSGLLSRAPEADDTRRCGKQPGRWPGGVSNDDHDRGGGMNHQQPGEPWAVLADYEPTAVLGGFVLPMTNVEYIIEPGPGRTTRYQARLVRFKRGAREAGLSSDSA
jgi:hypothetical protein